MNATIYVGRASAPDCCGTPPPRAGVTGQDPSPCAAATQRLLSAEQAANPCRHPGCGNCNDSFEADLAASRIELFPAEAATREWQPLARTADHRRQRLGATARSDAILVDAPSGIR